MVKRSLEITGGIILIAIGIIGLLLPLMPGAVPIFAGILLISPAHGKKIIDWLKKKWHEFKKNRP